MADPFIPLNQALAIAEMTHEHVDRFGDTRPVLGAAKPVPVAGWYVKPVDETAGDSVLRTVDRLTVFASEPFPPESQITLPDGTVWAVEGHARDYRHGPWFDPGLVVIHARRVEG